METMDPKQLSAAIQELDRLTQGSGPVRTPVITPPSLRVGIRKLLEPVLPKVPVISLSELPSHAGFEPLGIWELTHAD